MIGDNPMAAEAKQKHEPDPWLAGGDDLSPVPASKRNLSRWDMTLLWAGMVVCVPSYYLAGSLVELGMSWWQGVATIVLGTAIILFPLALTGHIGARYGIPFPVLLRAAFGVRGAHVPALLRAFVACGWCGIETSIGGQAIFLLLPSYLKDSWYAEPVRWLGTSVLEFSCFLFFLLAQLVILWKGMAGIRALEKFSAPLLILLTLWLFCWAYVKAGGFGEMLSAPSRLSPSEFWAVFLPSLTASTSFWSGISLNIPDFSRFARSHSGQVVGHLGLPFFMGLYTFAGLAIASSTATIYGRVISNPVDLLAEIGGPVTTAVGIFGISLATVTTNIPSNFVAPVNVLVSLSPGRFSFIGCAAVTGFASIAFQPWRAMQSSGNFVYTWLGGCSAILGPISGILLTDYYLVRRMDLDVNALYSVNPYGPYYYCRGCNIAAFAALVSGMAPLVPGFLYELGILEAIPEAFVAIYGNAWFVGIFSAAVIYLVLSFWRQRGKPTVVPSMLEPLEPAGL